jgi:Mor family transcriptional regulator
MVCRSCPARRHCRDKEICQECDFGEAYFKLERKIKRLEAKVGKLRLENEEMKKMSGGSAPGCIS